MSDEAISLNEKFDDLEEQLDTNRLGSNITEAEDLIQEHEAKRAVLDNVALPLIQRGEHLISAIKANEPPIPPSQNFPGSPASLPSQERQQVESIVTVLTHRCNQLLDMWEKRWKELLQCMDVRQFEAGYQKASAKYEVFETRHLGKYLAKHSRAVQISRKAFQGCALAAPGRLGLPLGDQEILVSATTYMLGALDFKGLEKLGAQLLFL